MATSEEDIAMRPRWTLITVTYNSANVLAEHWRQVLPGGVEWIVVDNASSDGSAEEAERLGARVFKLTENVGFGRANNIGFREAMGDLVAFVNPDVAVDVDSFDHLEDHVLAGGGLVAPQLVYGGGELQPGGRAAPSLSNKVLSRLGVRRVKDAYYIIAREGESRYVAWVIGAVVAATKRDWLRLGDPGPWDEKFFVYYEDSDLGLRAWSNGMTVRVVGGVRWIHSWSRATMRFRLTPWILEVTSMAKFYVRYPDLILGSGGRSRFKSYRAVWGSRT